MSWHTPALTLRYLLSVLVPIAGCGGRDATTASGTWQFKVDTARSDTDGSAHVSAWLRTSGTEHPPDAPGTKPAILSFDCFGDDAITTIITDQALRQGSTETRLTLDAGKPRRIDGFAGTTPSGGQVVLTIAQDSMLALLAGHQRAIIEYADGAGSSKTVAEFPVAGLEAHRANFRAECAKIAR
ncbi:MAG TPA: hypothetical protein VFJ50_06350 [Gemmatimonadales bacterium]|nr:hypothetical protein [Gemmatimonadales bacterium]